MLAELRPRAAKFPGTSRWVARGVWTSATPYRDNALTHVRLAPSRVASRCARSTPGTAYRPRAIRVNRCSLTAQVISRLPYPRLSNVPVRAAPPSIVTLSPTSTPPQCRTCAPRAWLREFVWTTRSAVLSAREGPPGSPPEHASERALSQDDSWPDLHDRPRPGAWRLRIAASAPGPRVKGRRPRAHRNLTRW